MTGNKGAETEGAAPRTLPGPCSAPCWTPVECPVCGNDLPPIGRSVPLEYNLPSCCDEGRYRRRNPRHLWDEHDGERWRDDPSGNKAHLAECERCRPDDDA